MVTSQQRLSSDKVPQTPVLKVLPTSQGCSSRVYTASVLFLEGKQGRREGLGTIARYKIRYLNHAWGLLDTACRFMGQLYTDLSQN